MPADRLPARHAGFTLLELLLALAIIAVLAALVFGAVGVVRSKARATQAKAMVMGLATALESYASEEVVHRFPLHEQLFVAASAPAYEVARSPLAGAPDGLIGLLSARQPFAQDGSRFDDAGRMLDPWGRPYLYHLKRPKPAAGAARLEDWNWDAGKARERTWSQAANVAAPYPYVWSLGASGASDDAAEWIYAAR